MGQQVLLAGKNPPGQRINNKAGKGHLGEMQPLIPYLQESNKADPGGGRKQTPGEAS